MIIHQEEVLLARAYDERHHFEALTDSQLSAIRTRGRALFHWFKAHPRTHNFINFCVIALVLGADYLVLVELPAVFLAGQEQSFGRVLLASAVCGGLHSYLLYSLCSISLHEGAAHQMVFVGKGPIATGAEALAENLCRLAANEPHCYATNHMTHHAKFGTDHDPEFLNFVVPRRYFLTFLPFATFINFTDFIAHRPPTYTRSRLISAGVAAAYNGTYAYVVYRSYGLPFMLLTMLIFLPHVGFYLDRVRQFTEHNLMPLDNVNGARSFGVGFWGLLVGGGPWGQPCHWEHHLVPSLPWYQQLLLHRHVVKLLTPKQREQFLIQPVIGFPRLWWRLIRDLNAFGRRPVEGKLS